MSPDEAIRNLLHYVGDGTGLMRSEHVRFRNGRYDSDSSSSNMEHNIQVQQAIENARIAADQLEQEDSAPAGGDVSSTWEYGCDAPRNGGAPYIGATIGGHFVRFRIEDDFADAVKRHTFLRTLQSHLNAAPAGGDVAKGDWNDWFKTWAKARGMTMQLTEDGRFLCPDTSLAQKAHEAGCMVSHMYYLELCRQEELAKSAPAGSGEVEDWMVELFDEVYEREWNRAADEADDRHKAIIGPADRHATREAIAALLRKLQQGADYVMVPRSLAVSGAEVCAEWLDLFAETPGLDKYERYTYAPCVEITRDQFRAASQGQEGGTNG